MDLVLAAFAMLGLAAAVAVLGHCLTYLAFEYCANDSERVSKIVTLAIGVGVSVLLCTLTPIDDWLAAPFKLRLTPGGWLGFVLIGVGFPIGLVIRQWARGIRGMDDIPVEIVLVGLFSVALSFLVSVTWQVVAVDAIAELWAGYIATGVAFGVAAELAMSFGKDAVEEAEAARKARKSDP